MNRGAGRRLIFHGREDREIFLQTLGEACHQLRIPTMLITDSERC